MLTNTQVSVAQPLLPWTTFRSSKVWRRSSRVRTLSCAEQYRSMAFAQLTYRESLFDIETCLKVHASKLYHMGFRQPVPATSTLSRCQRKARLAYPCGVGRAATITQARTLYVDEELGLDLTNTVYALDSTTIALCRRSFRALSLRHQGRGEDAHLSTCGATFRVLSTSRMASCTTFMPSICSCRKPEIYDRGSWLRRLCPPLSCYKPGPSSGHACQVEHRCSSRLFGADGSLDRIICDQISLDGYTRQDYPELLRRIRFNDRRVRQDAGLHHQQLLASEPDRSARSTKAAGRWNSSSSGSSRSSDQAVYGTSENAKTRSALPSRSTSSSPSSRSASTWTPRSTLCYRALGFRKISARPRHKGQNEFAVEDFKKTSPPGWGRSEPGSRPTPR